MARRLPLLAGLVVMVLVAGIGWRSSNQHLLTVAIQTMTLAALASSWNILGGFAGQISLGHAAFFGLGALITRESWLGGWPLLASMAVAVAVTSVVAVVVGIPMLRFRHIYFSIGTLALGVAVFLTVGNMRPGISSLPAEMLRNYSFTEPYFVTLAVLVVAVAVSVWLKNSKVGLGMMAVRDDEEAAAATGVGPLFHKMVAFVVSAALAGLAGAAFGYFTASYYPSFPFSVLWTFEAILVVFIGGVGTIAGPLIGSVFFVVGRDILPTDIGGYHVLIFGALFILVVLLLPGGMSEAAQRVIQRVSTKGTQTPKESKKKEMV